MLPGRDWGQRLAVAVGGPAVNALLSGFMFAGWCVTRQLGMPETASMFWYGGWINLFLIAFNVLPVWPLDGGRILVALIQGWVGLGYAETICGGLGATLAIMGILLAQSEMHPVLFVMATGLMVANVFLVVSGAQRLIAEHTPEVVEEKAVASGSWREKYLTLRRERGA